MVGTSCFEIAYCKDSGSLTTLLVGNQVIDQAKRAKLVKLLASTCGEVFCSGQVCKKLKSG